MRGIFTGLACAALCAAAAFCFSAVSDPPAQAAQGGSDCARIVSLGPSITETLFALGLGDRLVGATRHCTYPPQAARVPRIGGYMDPSYEAILAARPSVVLALAEHEVAMSRLLGLRLKTAKVPMDSVADILAAPSRIGQLCGAEKAANALRDEIAARLTRVERKTRGLGRPVVLIAVSSSLRGDGGELFAASRRTFLGEVLEKAGATNALRTDSVPYPRLSVESLLSLDPEVIFDASGCGAEAYALASEARAVRNGRVYALDPGLSSIPGPRVGELCEEIARRIHPDIDWSAP